MTMAVVRNRIERAPAARIYGLALAALVLLLLALSGCASTPDSDNPNVRRTGTYPNINIRPETAATRMSNEEAQAGIDDLDGKREAIAEEMEDPPESDEERLRDLAENHAARTIDEIENPLPPEDTDEGEQQD